MIRKFKTPGSSGKTDMYRAVLMALTLLQAGCNREDEQAGKAPPAAAQGTQPAAPQPAAPQAQASAPPAVPPPAAPPPAPAAKPLTDLESLVAPIALYPDPLLAELLVASTYPLEVVQAARWLDTKPDLATLSTKDWDASIMRLASVPDVLKMMNDHLDWTTALGDAFLAKPAELMDAIQALRKRATDSGFLKDTSEQKVTAKTVSAGQPAEGAAETAGAESGAETVKATPAVLKKEVITIEPAKSDTIYVPQYNPESVYQAPLAPPPTTTAAAYPATTAGYAYPAAAPPPAYYPAYYPPPATTTTTSTTDSLVTFGAGALAGGLLTWGIMEWADDDDWDDHYHGGYPVNHYYGGAVCNNGNCWHGGGGGNYDRGNINRNTNINRDRDVNISGNEINIERGGVFSQRDLQPAQVRANWQPDARHRRGQAYPPAAQQRLGRTAQPALAGQRLGAAQTLPATARGFGEGGARPGTLPAERRPSSAEIRQRLGEKPGTPERRGEQPGQPRPAARDIQGQLGQGSRENALAGLRDSGQAARLESRRGAESRRQTPAAGRQLPAREAAGGERRQRAQIEQPRQFQAESRPQVAERRAVPQRTESRQAFEGRQREQVQQMDRQRRSETSRPNAFEGDRSGRATQSFSQRGAASRQAAASGGGRFGGGGTGAGGGRFGGGGGMRGGGGGGRRR